MTISQFCGLRRAKIPGADPGASQPRQPAPSWPQVSTGHAQIGFGLSRRNCLVIEMQKQQIFKIKPDGCFQAAGLRAPRTGIDAQFVKNGKNGFQAPFQFFSQNGGHLKFAMVKALVKFHRLVGSQPCPRGCPGHSRI